MPEGEIKPLTECSRNIKMTPRNISPRTCWTSIAARFTFEKSLKFLFLKAIDLLNVILNWTKRENSER